MKDVVWIITAIIAAAAITISAVVYMIMDLRMQHAKIDGLNYRREHGEFKPEKYYSSASAIKDKEWVSGQTNGGIKPEEFKEKIQAADYTGQLKMNNCSQKKRNCELENVIDTAWNAISEIYESCRAAYPSLVFHEENKEKFKKIFSDRYKDTMRRFMREGTQALDSHKQAALLTISCLESGVLEHLQTKDDKISIVPQMIAVDVGLSYMLKCLNKRLKEKRVNKEIKRYYFPVATACETPYSEILCRTLYHEQIEPDMSFNVLDLANQYFTLEYINLLQQGIEPVLLKDSAQ